MRRYPTQILLVLATCGPALLAQSAPASIDPGPAPYVAPTKNAVLVYTGGLTQRIDSVVGWRTIFTDNTGKRGAMVGLFVADMPASPRNVDLEALKTIWPLKVGGKATVAISAGQEQWEGQFKVVGTERVTIRAGEYDTYVVEGTQAPKRVANPRQPTLVTTWWYAPALGAVVRFVTTARGTQGTGKVRRFELVTIRPPAPRPS